MDFTRKPPKPAWSPAPDAKGGAVDELGKPGRLEGYADENADWYLQPSESQQYWNSQQGNFAGGPQQSYAEQFYGSDPGLDPYYNRAYDTGSQRMNSRYAAMGVGGGSAALNADAEMMGGLKAEQANREADFRLRQATAADTGRNQSQQTWLDTMTTGGKLAGAGDRGELDRRTAGANVAGGADEMTLNRNRTLFDWLFAGAGGLSNVLKGFGDPALKNDQELLEGVLQGGLGGTKSGVEAGQTTREQASEDVGNILKL